MAQVFMDPAPVQMAARSALMTSGMRARAVAEARNPAPRRIGISGPTPLRTGNGALLRGTGPIAHLFEGGTRDHFVSPGVQQGFKRLGKRHSRTGDYFIRPSQPSSRYASSYQSATAGGLGWATPRAGEQSHEAIRFNRGDRGFYRGVGFKVSGMKAKPFMDPALRFWIEVYPQDLAKLLARFGGKSANTLARSLGMGGYIG